MSVDYGPRDLCPLGHGPMWWWPSGGEWACQRPTCEETRPVYAYEVLDRKLARHGANWAMPPRSIFVTTIS